MKACNRCIYYSPGGFCHHPSVIIKTYTDSSRGRIVKVWNTVDSERRNATLCGKDAKHYKSGGPFTEFFNYVCG